MASLRFKIYLQLSQNNPCSTHPQLMASRSFQLCRQKTNQTKRNNNMKSLLSFSYTHIQSVTISCLPLKYIQSQTILQYLHGCRTNPRDHRLLPR